MIIIFEGIDRAGKSTIIKKMREIYTDVIVFKLSEYYKPSDDDPVALEKLEVAYDELFNQARVLSHDQGKTVIFDRAYPSELVYSKPMRGYDAFENLFWLKLDQGLSKYGKVLYVYIEPPKEEDHLQRLIDEGSHLAQETIKEILERYEYFWRETNLKKIRLSGGNDPQSNVESIMTEVMLTQ